VSIRVRGGISGPTGVLLITFLSACGPGAPGQSQLLAQLHQCRAEIPQRVSSGSFYSPCIKRDPSPLNGLSRSALTRALGPADLCVGRGTTGAPEGPECGPDANSLWHFFRLAQPSAGTGIELVCEIQSDQHCARVYWTQTE
jgi:hypothetical protein